MSFSYDTYLMYGVHIPIERYAWEESERAGILLAQFKNRCPDVGYATAGAYDEDRFFLVTRNEQVSLGTFERIPPSWVNFTPELETEWDRQLTEAAQLLGFTPDTLPGWIVIPDQA